MKELDAVIRRVAQLRNMHAYRDREKELIRAVCGGSEEGLKALLGDLGGVAPESMPAPNLALKGMERMAQKIGTPPDLRVDPTDDTKTARKQAEKRARMVATWDEADDIEGLLYQSGMWLPGYAFTVWLIREGVTAEGVPYPQTENVDPYNAYPGFAKKGDQPRDLAVAYSSTARDLAARYPQHRIALLGERMSHGGVLLDPVDYPVASSQYGVAQQGIGGSIEYVEYYDEDDCWVVVPTKNLLLEHYRNPIAPEPQFVVTERFSFGRPVGQYDHSLGLQATIAQFYVLAALALKEGVFAERNVYGELISGQYRTGYKAINYLTPGTRVERPTTNLPYQLFQFDKDMERHFRAGANYPVIDDAVAPAAQATGQGIEKLMSQGVDLAVKQYLSRFRRSLQLKDRKQLMLMERSYPDLEIEMAGERKGESFNETYRPTRDIKGQYRTRRTYGAMAGLEDSAKMVSLLQLKGAELWDDQTVLEEMDNGGRAVTQIMDRVRKQKADQVVYQTLMARAAEGDERAMLAMVEIRGGEDADEVLKKFFTPQDPQMSPEELAMVAPQPAAPAGPPPLPQDVMAMLAQAGGPQGDPAMQGAVA